MDLLPEAKAFIEFLKSDEVASIFEKYGFIIIK
ncbi:substrate-binding domain-containing protein [Aerosakkonema funiforme]